MSNWIEKYYSSLISCENKLNCLNAASIESGQLFYPMPPKIFGLNPKIILIAMEPGGAWTSDNNEAKGLINKGVRCFWSHLGDFTLHFSVQSALAEVFGENHLYDYYITNMAKCALKTKNAKISQSKRWGYCQKILIRELEYIIKDRNIESFPIFISIGNDPKEWIRCNPPLIISRIFSLKFQAKIPHYSKSKLHINLPKLLNGNNELKQLCDREILNVKENLYKFVKTETEIASIGTEKALQEIENEKYLNLYSKLAIVYRYVLKQNLNQSKNLTDISH